jgi:hypothetical protein
MSIPKTRGEVAAAAVAVVGVAVVAAALLVARGWWGGAGGSYAPPHPVARASVTPARSLFGQVLTASASVLIDPRTMDPSSVAARVIFRPFAVRSESRRTRHGVGRAEIVTLTFRIQCIVRACVPKGAAGRARGAATLVQFEPGRVTARRRDGTSLSVPIEWPPVGVQSRLTSDDIAFSTPELDPGFTPPPFHFRTEPNLLAGGALGLAVVFVAGAGWLVIGGALTDTRPLRRRRIPAHLTPVERALILAERAVARLEIAESRKALERLAVLLRAERLAGQADDAERLAWSEEAPSRESLASLADSVRSSGD